MGVGHYDDLGGEWIDFNDNLVTNYSYFDHANLFACCYINLRESSISYLDTHQLSHLVYIDISYSKIRFINFRRCIHLVKVVIDEIQIAKVVKQNIVWMLLVKDKNLTVNSPVMPAKAPNSIYDTSGVYGKEIVSFGRGYSDLTVLPDYNIDFNQNLVQTKEIDAVNLL